jgi:hypothetical protein
MAETTNPPTTPTRNPLPQGGISPSPLKAQHKTPPTSKTQTYYHQPDGRPRHKIQTPGGSIQALPRFPGASHQVGMRDDGGRYAEEDFDAATTFTAQWECLLLTLSNLRNRANQDFKRYERSFSHPYPPYDWMHHHYTRLAIETCLSKIKTCLNSTQTNVDVIDVLNTSIQEGRIYNPFGLRTIYPDDYTYAYNAAQKTWIYARPLYATGFKYITPQTQPLPKLPVMKTTPLPADSSSSSGKKRPIATVDAKEKETELREKVFASFKRKKAAASSETTAEPPAITPIAPRK